MSFIPDDLYRAIVGCMPIPCVDVAIIDAGAILLVRRKDSPALGHWWVPGGRVLKGEMMADAAARKAREEVGLDCIVGRIVHTAETIFPDGPYGLPIHSVNTCFLLHPKSPGARPALDSHHDDFRWVKGIPPGLHPYVTACLRGAGLNPEPNAEYDW